ncbi:Soluble inorganic pyrophosphatase 4, partial [Bienertia sinuspersici]
MSRRSVAAHPWHDLEIGSEALKFSTVVEIPKGSKVKLIEYYTHPWSTLTTMVSFQGHCVKMVILWMNQLSPGASLEPGPSGEKDDKIIAVCADDPEVRHYTDINQLPPHRLAEIRRFFEDCILQLSLLFLDEYLDKKNECKEVAVDDFLPSKNAHDAIQHS